jgi:hypothetical protein
MTPNELTRIQCLVVGPALAQLGNNQHMPRAVVFASKLKGGIGILDLKTKQ